MNILGIPHIANAMLIKSQVHWSSVLEKKIFKGFSRAFTIYGRGGHLGHVSKTQDHLNEFSFPCPKESPYQSSIGSVVSEKMFENVDGRESLV